MISLDLYFLQGFYFILQINQLCLARIANFLRLILNLEIIKFVVMMLHFLFGFRLKAGFLCFDMNLFLKENLLIEGCFGLV